MVILLKNVKFFCNLFLFILLVLFPVTAQEVEYLLVEGNSIVNVREGPGLDYNIVKKLDQGEKIVFLLEQGDWYKVSLDNGTYGWVYSPLVTGPFSDNLSQVVDWCCYRGDVSHTGSISGEKKPSGKQRWSITVDSEINFSSSPVFFNSNAYIGLENGKLLVIDINNGKTKELFFGEAPIKSTPSIDNDNIYLETEDGKVYSIDLATGKENWDFDREGDSSGYSILVGDKDLIYTVGNNNKTVYALDKNRGELVWSFTEEGENIFSSPCLSGKELFFGSSQGIVYCLDNRSGTLLWKFNSEACAGITLAYEDYLYVVVSETKLENQRDLYTSLGSIDILTGEKQWDFRFDAQVFIPVIMNDTVYIGCQNNSFYSINAFSGEQNWIIQEELYPLVMAGSGENLYVGLYDGTIFSLDVSTKQKIWSLKIEGVPGLPAISDGVLYIPVGEGKIFSIE